MLEGEKVYLRYLTIKDARELKKICNDISVHRFTHVPYPYSIKDALEFIRKCRINRKKGIEFVYGIFEKKTKRLVGTVSFVRINKKNNNAEIGYLVGKEFRNRGYATEAARLLLDYGFKKFKFHKIYLCCAKENKVSKKVIKKLGAKKEALLKQDIFVGNKYHDNLVHSIFRKDWLKNKNVKAL